MKYFTKLYYWPLFLAFITSMLAFSAREASAQGERRFIREGNRLYNKEQFDESELSYRRALERDRESPQARFNLGNSLYRQQRYDEALGFFDDLTGEIDDPLNRSKVFHNLGNSLLMSGQVEQSIEAYKEALRNNPGDSETRYNLAFARNLLDEMEKEQQQDESQDQEDSQDKEQEQKGDPGQEDTPPQDQDQAPQPRPDEISPEDALRLLEAAEREEQRVQEKLDKAPVVQPRAGRNW
jgi:Ca-activated chloride channel homolog